MIEGIQVLSDSRPSRAKCVFNIWGVCCVRGFCVQGVCYVRGVCYIWDVHYAKLHFAVTGLLQT